MSDTPNWATLAIEAANRKDEEEAQALEKTRAKNLRELEAMLQPFDIPLYPEMVEFKHAQPRYPAGGLLLTTFYDVDHGYKTVLALIARCEKCPFESVKAIRDLATLGKALLGQITPQWHICADRPAQETPEQRLVAAIRDLVVEL